MSRVTTRLMRALFARFLCLCHICLSIYVLVSVKNNNLIFLIPLFGALFLIIESFLVTILNKGKEPTVWFSPVFCIYVVTIVSCYWLLELENISKALAGNILILYFLQGQHFLILINFLLGNKIVYDYNKFKYNQEIGDIITFVKIVWSQLELQIFFGLLIFIRWLIPKSNLSPQGLAELLVKYFAIACDMLDFLTILQDDQLIKNESLVYATLSIWTWSTFQFFIYVPTYDDEEKREFSAYISNSVLGVLFMDLPYLGEISFNLYLIIRLKENILIINLS